MKPAAAKFVPTLLGLVVAAALLALLALTRLLVSSEEPPDYELREIETTVLPEPPPPPPEEPPPEAPPPPPALTDVREIPDPTRVPVPEAELPMDLETPVDPFFTDLAPAPLPEPPQPAAKPSRPSPPAPSRPSKPAAPPVPVAKSHYGVGELDGKPRLLRHGSAAFPPKLARRGVDRGTVVLEVELDERGRVKIRRVVSATHSELIAPARRVAASASFTAPTRNGRAVKSIMRWPITIRR